MTDMLTPRTGFAPSARRFVGDVRYGWALVIWRLRCWRWAWDWEAEWQARPPQKPMRREVL